MSKDAELRLRAEIIREQKAEVEQLREDIQYALDRLSTEADQGPGLRVLIDDATNHGDYFPSYELKRRKEQIHEINRHVANFLEFNAEIIAEVKRLREAALGGLALANIYVRDEDTSVEQQQAVLTLLNQNSWLGQDESPPLRFILDRIWPDWLIAQTQAAEATKPDEPAEKPKGWSGP